MMNAIKRRLARLQASQDGWVVIIAVMIMTLMLAVGLAIFKLSDTQMKQGRIDRERESAFNLAEGALVAQSYRLPSDWPSDATLAFPPQCDPTTSANAKCPP